ncbi:MAG TPA: hypothetical protein VEJ46_11895 [Candidatus Acidoferrum sp.]|nr:hypothetical protein [Candidatus Acidoferrum sp.]
MKPTTLARRNAEREFVSDSLRLAPLDRRGLPLNAADLKRAAQDETDPLAPDPRFAGLTPDSSVGAKALKQFLSNLDEAAVRETGDPALIQEYEEAHSDSVVHLAGWEARVRKIGSEWTATLDLDGEKKMLKAPSRDALMEKLVSLCRALDAEQKKDATRELTENERLECIRYAQQGLVQESIGRFLYYAFNGRDIDWFRILDDPRYRDVCDEACALAWVHSRDNYSPTPEREEYIHGFCAGRPLTISLLDAAWTACQEAERSAASTPDATPAPVPESVALDDLSDSEIEAEYKAAMRARSRRG